MGGDCPRHCPCRMPSSTGRAGLNRADRQAGLPSGVSEPPKDTAAARAVLPSVPPCKAGATATLTSGLRVRYNGADRQDPQVCLVSWKGRTHRYFVGFWVSGRFRKGTLPEREAIRPAMTGPVGSRTSFDDTRADMWGKVTVEHVANPTLVLRDGTRRTIQLRVVRHDVRGRLNVRRVVLHWMDVKTGVALKRQTVTDLSDSQQQVFTTWKFEHMEDAVS